jgi:alpha-glucosidase
MAPDVTTRNVARQSADPGSILSFYRRLIWLRRTQPALQVGTYRRLAASREVFAYVRATEGEALAIAVNFGRAPGWVELGPNPGATGWRRLLATHEGVAAGVPDRARMALRPFEAIVLGGV